MTFLTANEAASLKPNALPCIHTREQEVTHAVCSLSLMGVLQQLKWELELKL